ncbi:MAG: DUF58 domain-containing protein [Roseibacillus sp.]
MSSATSALDDPELFLALDDLELVAQGLAEGAWQGTRRSRMRGEGMEFEGHREYRVGDDPRHVNWSLYARSRRLQTREFRPEVNLPLYLMLDVTGSMTVQNGARKKLKYGTAMAAAMAYLAGKARDSHGVILLGDGVVGGSRMGSGQRHFDEVSALLAGTDSFGEGEVGEALDRAREMCRRRGMVVLFSDLFDKEEDILKGIRALRADGHEVTVFQVLDPIEIELPKKGDIEFVDAETGRKMKTSVAAIRENYEAAVRLWRENFQRECEAVGAIWQSARTDEPMADALREWMQTAMQK